MTPLPSPDDRTGDRRTDVLLIVQLDSDDTRSEEEEITGALLHLLEGQTFYPNGMRSAQVIHAAVVREVDTVQRGRKA